MYFSIIIKTNIMITYFQHTGESKKETYILFLYYYYHKKQQQQAEKMSK